MPVCGDGTFKRREPVTQACLRQHLYRVEHIEASMTVAAGKAYVFYTHSVLDRNLALHGTLTKGNSSMNTVDSRKTYSLVRSS